MDLSAFFLGLAGVFFTQLLNYLPLSARHWTNSGEVVVMGSTGGTGTLYRPVPGALGVILLRNIFSNYTGSWGLIRGILFVAAAFGFGSGLVGIPRTRLRLKR